MKILAGGQFKKVNASTLTANTASKPINAESEPESLRSSISVELKKTAPAAAIPSTPSMKLYAFSNQTNRLTPSSRQRSSGEHGLSGELRHGSKLNEVVEEAKQRCAGPAGQQRKHEQAVSSEHPTEH